MNEVKLKMKWSERKGYQCIRCMTNLCEIVWKAMHNIEGVQRTAECNELLYKYRKRYTDIKTLFLYLVNTPITFHRWNTPYQIKTF